MFETEYSATDIVKSIEINGSKEVAWLSMYTDDGIAFNGIRLYDSNFILIVDVIWNVFPRSSSTWTELYEIPQGHQIIGVACNASEDEINSNIRSLQFIVGPIPP